MFNDDIFAEDEYLPSTVSDQLVPVETLQSYQTISLQNENALGSVLFDVALSCSVVGLQTQSSGHVVLESLWPFPKPKQRSHSLRKKIKSSGITDSPEKQLSFQNAENLKLPIRILLMMIMTIRRKWFWIRKQMLVRFLQVALCQVTVKIKLTWILTLEIL